MNYKAAKEGCPCTWCESYRDTHAWLLRNKADAWEAEAKSRDDLDSYTGIAALTIAAALREVAHVLEIKDGYPHNGSRAV